MAQTITVTDHILKPQPGVIEFFMQGTSLDIVNPDQTLYLKSSDGSKTYVVWLGYYSGSGYQNIYGMARTVNAALPQAKDGPLGFSQGNSNWFIRIKIDVAGFNRSKALLLRWAFIF